MTVPSRTGVSLSAATVHEAAGRIGALPSPIKPLCVRGTGKDPHGDGGLGEPIRFGDVTVHPGDLIIGDPDGVVCVPAATADQVRNKALERERAEAGYIQRLRTGETTLAIYQLP